MRRILKKSAILFTVATMVLSCAIPAFAQSEMDNMVFAGYDLTNPESPNRIYNEVINGQYTNKQVLVPADPQWKAEGYEAVYPYAGYSRMYLDNKKQPVTAYNNLFPQWETRRRDYMWEMKSPYIIWERQQTKVNGKQWQWDYGNEKFGISDSVVKTRTNRQAYVTDISMKKYGFGSYLKDGTPLNDANEKMYQYFGVKASDEWNQLVSSTLTAQKLSEKDENNRYVLTDDYLKSIIPVVRSKFITAKFNAKGNAGLATKNVAAEYLLHADESWQWDGDSFDVVYNAKIDWTKPSYEMAEPYNYYQYLIVDGVVLDGTNGKDRILRYTGGKATPKVEWKFAFFQLAQNSEGADVYEIVEQKYVDGAKATNAQGEFIYRIPTGEYANTYFKLNGNLIEYWAVDRSGNKALLGTTPNTTGNLGGLIDAYMSGSLKYSGYISADN